MATIGTFKPTATGFEGTIATLMTRRKRKTARTTLWNQDAATSAWLGMTSQNQTMTLRLWNISAWSSMVLKWQSRLMQRYFIVKTALTLSGLVQNLTRNKTWKWARIKMRTQSVMSNLPTIERELEDCLAVVACVIDHHGDNYWPVYKLFEEELERLRSRRRRLNKTLSHIPSFQKARIRQDVHWAIIFDNKMRFNCLNLNNLEHQLLQLGGHCGP